MLNGEGDYDKLVSLLLRVWWAGGTASPTAHLRSEDPEPDPHPGPMDGELGKNKPDFHCSPSGLHAAGKHGLKIAI